MKTYSKKYSAIAIHTMQLTIITRLGLLMSFCAIAGGASYYLILRPALDLRFSIIKKTQQLHALFHSTQKKQISLKRMAKQLRILKTLYPGLHKKVFNKKTSSENSSLFVDLIKKEALQLEMIQPLENKLNVKLSGSFSHILHFLKQLPFKPYFASPHFVRILQSDFNNESNHPTKLLALETTLEIID